MKTVVYVMDTRALSEPSAFAKGYSEVPKYRQEKIDKCKMNKDKYLSLGAGMLLEHALKEAGLPGKLAITTGPVGKPYFRDYPKVHFNLSHSGSMVMCILSDYEAGCDVEKIKPGRERVAKRFFSAEEKAFLESEEDFDRAFYRIWTRKESYMKATGQGILLDPLSFSAVSDGERSRFWEFTFGTEYCFACCLLDAPKEHEVEFYTL